MFPRCVVSVTCQARLSLKARGTLAPLREAVRVFDCHDTDTNKGTFMLKH
ncbi:hypothetical protein PLCT2_02311 [Planctomycetaceae bacterium]|nr:hypothetical protein PLCT2_02311 [Planctomycetaceae bacterium]